MILGGGVGVLARYACDKSYMFSAGLAFAGFGSALLGSDKSECVKFDGKAYYS